MERIESIEKEKEKYQWKGKERIGNEKVLTINQ
jgi:hypothetical protein